MRVLGETTVTVLERTFDIVVTLVRDGPAAAWQKILENLQNLQEMVFGQIREWVTRTIVVQAVTRIASMLNPAGAVIQAIIAIYNTIMFVRERLQQIIQVAEAFFNSIAQIASGAVGAAANYVERTMARLVPVVISFLARLIGLGGISDTIRNIIARIRAPIDRALDRVVDWIVAQARRLGAMARATARSILLRFTRPKSFSTPDGTHQMWVSEEGEPQVASRAMPLGTRIGAWKRRVSSLPPADRTTANTQIGIADGLNGDLRRAATDALRARAAGNATAVDAAQAIIDAKQAALQPVLATLFRLFGDTATAAGAEQEARIFALVETYDQVVVPLKRRSLVTGTPSTVSQTFRSQWNRNQFAQARGWILQMERVLAAARNVGTGRFPYLTGVEVRIPGTEIDYTIRDRDVENKVDIDIAVEVKNWGAIRERAARDGRIITVAEQIQQRINTLRNQVESSLRNPTYSAVIVEIRGYTSIPAEMRSTLGDEFINYRALAESLNKRFRWRRV